MLGPPGSGQEPPVTLVDIVDPVAGYHYILDPVHQVAHRVAVQTRQNRTPSAAVAVSAAVVTPPPFTMPNGATMTNESLGARTIFGVMTIGMRSTTTYPEGTFQGNDRPVVMVNESWRAAQDSIVLLSKNIGPNGETTMTMKDFSTDEPDPALFQIPAGYQIVDETGQFTITIPRKAQ